MYLDCLSNLNTNLELLSTSCQGHITNQKEEFKTKNKKKNSKQKTKRRIQNKKQKEEFGSHFNFVLSDKDESDSLMPIC